MGVAAKGELCTYRQFQSTHDKQPHAIYEHKLCIDEKLSTNTNTK
jgi:hypothetical protein